MIAALVLWLSASAPAVYDIKCVNVENGKTVAEGRGLLFKIRILWEDGSETYYNRDKWVCTEKPVK